MTMISFRVDATEAQAAQKWASRLGIDRSELLRRALHTMLVQLAAEAEIEAWNRLPLDEGERSMGTIADWGPAEDWSDWADAAR